MTKEAVFVHKFGSLVLEHITSITTEKISFNGKESFYVNVYTTRVECAARFHFDSETSAMQFHNTLIEKINDWYKHEEPLPAPPHPSEETFTITPYGIIKQPLK